MPSPILTATITVLGVIATAFVTWLIAQRQITAKHVTAERAKWRKRIRRQSLKAHDAIVWGNTQKIFRLQNEFRALLNPSDCKDRKILCYMSAEGSYSQRQARAKQFSEQIALLLKHDWERAKLEAGFFVFRWILEARRKCWNGENESDSRKCVSCKKQECCRWNKKASACIFGDDIERYKVKCTNKFFLILKICLLTIMVAVFVGIITCVIVYLSQVCARQWESTNSWWTFCT